MVLTAPRLPDANGKKDMAADEVKEYQTGRQGVIPQLFYLSPDYTLSYLGTEKWQEKMLINSRLQSQAAGDTGILFHQIGPAALKDESNSTQEGQEITTITGINYQKAGNLLLPFTITHKPDKWNLTYR